MASGERISMSQINQGYVEDEGESSHEEDGRIQGDMDTIPLWNVFRKQNYRLDTGIFTDFGRKLLKTTKVLTYVFLCSFVFVGVIAAKGSLQILATQLYNEIRQGSVIHDRTVTEDAISWLLIMIVCIPDLLKVTQCILNFIFGDRGYPKCLKFILTQLKEVLHVVGLFGLLFRVMPFMGPVETSAILAAIPGVPAIVQIIFIRKAHRSKSFIRTLISIVSALVLVLAVVVIGVFVAGMGHNETADIELITWTVASCVLLSLRWVETYIVREKRDTEDLYKIRAKTSDTDGDSFNYMVSSGLRLAVSAILISQYFCLGIRDPNTTFTLFRNITHTNNGAVSAPPTPCTNTNTTNCPTPYPYIVWLPWEILPSFLIHFFSSVLVYHFAVTACKLCMQRACFTIPLLIASPVYVIATLASLESGLDWALTMFQGTRPEPSLSVYVALVVFAVAWLGQVWVCRQAWREPTERLCFVRKLFVLPHYCSPVLDLSLLHSRRRMRTMNLSTSQKAASTSKIYICATMWHENRIEMKQILTSLFRLDMDQFSRRKAQEEFKDNDPDYYEFEGHVPFDDAMTTKDNKRVPNDFVEQLIEVIDEAGSVVHKRDISLGQPDRFITPYGGRLVWHFPGGNKLIVHLKDKEKIRHKKRWSQIMYMYYLIGYEMVEQNRSEFDRKFTYNFENCRSIFEVFPENIRLKAENTYFLALDGDVDFQPEAIRLLVDRMKKDPKVGATCGRIKPGGSGPVVWYQKFEYAIGHWLQKSAEHVFGCVLCSPGCFSLFRAKALMDDNVMRTYAILPTEPRHYLQYDQGEDRWLCTLMLQQGYRIEYCAAAEALTFAPEEFKEFFNQRRRWLPSTMANIMDLLESHSRTTKKNSNISYLYVIYQMVLFTSSVLGPSTVLLAIESSFRAVFPVAPWVSYLLIYGPTLIFIFICLKFKTNTQLNVAMVLSALYAMAMMAVIVGIIVSIAGDGWYTPTAVFLYILIASFILAGIFHMHEFTDLLFGVIYFICIPAGYLFLIIFAICNLNDVSWGTRETQKAVLEHPGRPKKPKIKEAEDEFSEAAQEVLANIVKQVKAEKVGMNSCTDAVLSIFRWINNLVVLKALSTMQNIFKNDPDSTEPATPVTGKKHTRGFSIYKKSVRMKNTSDAMDDTSWAKKSPKQLSEKETSFWDNLIQTYLYPLDHDEKKKREVSEMLKDFRNHVSFAFFFVNGLWVIIMIAMNQVKDTVSVTVWITSTYSIEFEPLGFIFLLIFAILLLMQLVGMVVHRYETLLHVISATDLRSTTDDMVKVRLKIQEMASQGTSDADDDDNIRSSTRSTDIDTTENIDDLEAIYEDFQECKIEEKPKSRPKVKERLNLERNYRKTVRNMKRRQTMKKQTRQNGTDM